MSSSISDPPPTDSVQELIPEASDISSLTSITGGTNNRVFRIDTGNRTYLLKQYFSHPEDDRDRLQTEFSFSRFLWDNGIERIPRPIGKNCEENLALYEFIDGSPPSPEDLDQSDVLQAADFFRAINQNRDADDAQGLPNASAACFSIEEHLTAVDERFDQLKKISSNNELHHEAKKYVGETMLPLWESLRNDVRNQAKSEELSIDRSLEPSERYLSPSDFGFHNVIVNGGGDFYFHDFEYAGWDDPAKAAADCFGQPEYPLEERHLKQFVRTMIPGNEKWQDVFRRTSMLLPVHKLKWCCILLNDFLPVSGQRRKFSQSESDQKERKRNQLNKARNRVQSISQQESK